MAMPALPSAPAYALCDLSTPGYAICASNEAFERLVGVRTCSCDATARTTLQSVLVEQLTPSDVGEPRCVTFQGSAPQRVLMTCTPLLPRVPCGGDVASVPAHGYLLCSFVADTGARVAPASTSARSLRADHAPASTKEQHRASDGAACQGCGELDTLSMSKPLLHCMSASSASTHAPRQSPPLLRGALCMGSVASSTQSTLLDTCSSHSGAYSPSRGSRSFLRAATPTGPAQGATACTHSTTVTSSSSGSSSRRDVGEGRGGSDGTSAVRASAHSDADVHCAITEMFAATDRRLHGRRSGDSDLCPSTRGSAERTRWHVSSHANVTSRPLSEPDVCAVVDNEDDVDCVATRGHSIGKWSASRSVESMPVGETLSKRLYHIENEVRGQFLANMSHELRTPLNGIIAIMELLRGSKLAPEQLELADTALESARSLLHVLGNILDFSQADAGLLALAHQPVSVREVVEGAIDIVWPEASRKQLLMTHVLPASVTRLHVMGDALRLRRILVHLLSNAVKFTEAGSVELLVQRSPYSPKGLAALTFRVVDTGVGVPESFRPFLFSAFRQASDTRTRCHDGLGLGLALSARLAGLMNGRVAVESSHLGGTTVSLSVSLPLAPEAGSGLAPPASAPCRVSTESERSADGRPVAAVLALKHSALQRQVAAYCERLCASVTCLEHVPAWSLVPGLSTTDGRHVRDSVDVEAPGAVVLVVDADAMPAALQRGWKRLPIVALCPHEPLAVPLRVHASPLALPIKADAFERALAAARGVMARTATLTKPLGLPAPAICASARAAHEPCRAGFAGQPCNACAVCLGTVRSKATPARVSLDNSVLDKPCRGLHVPDPRLEAVAEASDADDGRASGSAESTDPSWRVLSEYPCTSEHTLGASSASTQPSAASAQFGGGIAASMSVNDLASVQLEPSVCGASNSPSPATRHVAQDAVASPRDTLRGSAHSGGSLSSYVSAREFFGDDEVSVLRAALPSADGAVGAGAASAASRDAGRHAPPRQARASGGAGAQAAPGECDDLVGRSAFWARSAAEPAVPGARARARPSGTWAGHALLYGTQAMRKSPPPRSGTGSADAPCAAKGGMPRASLSVPDRLCDAGDDAAAASAPSASRMRILIAEDNRINQLVVTRVLRSVMPSCEIEVVADGLSATEAILYRGEPGFDLVLMDIHMPRMDGYEATRLVREAHPRRPRIIALTADTLAGVREKCERVGMDDCIVKPFNITDMHRILSSA